MFVKHVMKNLVGSVFKLIYPKNAYDFMAVCQKKPTYAMAKSCLCSSTEYL